MLLVYSTVPIILLMGGYYFFYVKSRTTEISERNLRVLATASKQIETRLNGLTLVLSNAACQCADVDLKRWSEWPERVTDKDPDKRIQCCLRHSSLRELPALHILDPPTASRGAAEPSLDRITTPCRTAPVRLGDGGSAELVRDALVFLPRTHVSSAMG
jgi:hypothetical protein